MKTKLVSFDRVEHLLGQPGPGETPSTNQESLRAAKAALRTALFQDLTDRQRECVLLYFYEGLTEEETGRRLELSRSTVCRHLQRAKRHLKKAAYYAGSACRALPEEDFPAPGTIWKGDGKKHGAGRSA